MQLTDMAAAVHWINNLPGRYCGVLFGKPAGCSFISFSVLSGHLSNLVCTGMSLAASTALFYAARVADVPAVFMAEPDDIVILSGQI